MIAQQRKHSQRGRVTSTCLTCLFLLVQIEYNIMLILMCSYILVNQYTNNIMPNTGSWIKVRPTVNTFYGYHTHIVGIHGMQVYLF